MEIKSYNIFIQCERYGLGKCFNSKHLLFKTVLTKESEYFYSNEVNYEPKFHQMN